MKMLFIGFSSIHTPPGTVNPSVKCIEFNNSYYLRNNFYVHRIKHVHTRTGNLGMFSETHFKGFVIEFGLGPKRVRLNKIKLRSYVSLDCPLSSSVLCHFQNSQLRSQFPQKQKNPRIESAALSDFSLEQFQSRSHLKRSH